MLRGALVPTLVAGALTVLVLGLVRGGAGAGAAVIGVAIAVAFFSAGLKVIGHIVEQNPVAAFAGAMAVYLGQLIFLALVVIVLRQVAWLDAWACGIAVFVATIVWQVFQARAYLRMRQPVYDDPAPSVPTDEGGAR
jgi:hypothetical protein